MKFCLLLLAGALCFGQERIVPFQMSQANMLLGWWHCRQLSVHFYTDGSSQMIIGKVRPGLGNGAWRRMMLIFPEKREIRAEFFDAEDHAIHYRLRTAERGSLRFEDDPRPGAPLHHLTYERQPGGNLWYRFETGDQTTDSGVMQPEAIVRPLSE